MARNPRREANLDRIAKRQRAVGQKVSKIENQGIRVKAGGFDPRLPMSQVRSMTGKQLAAYERKLNTFMDRRTQFTGLFGGQAVPRSTWNTYQRLERTYNRITAEREAPILGLKLPGSDGGFQDMTIGQRLGIGPDNPPAANASFRIFQKIDRDPRFIMGPAKLDKLIAQMKEKVRPDFLDKAIGPRLNSLNALLKGSGNEDFIDRIAKLTPWQQAVLADYSTFASIAEDRFYPDSQDQQERDADFELRTGASRADDVHDQLERVFQWVINEVAPEPGRGTSRFPDVGPSARAIPTQGRGERTEAGSIPVQQARWTADDTNVGSIPRQSLPFNGHRVGDFIMSERSNSVWQVEQRNRANGTVTARNVENGRRRTVKPENYISIEQHNRKFR